MCVCEVIKKVEGKQRQRYTTAKVTWWTSGRGLRLAVKCSGQEHCVLVRASSALLSDQTWQRKKDNSSKNKHSVFEKVKQISEQNKQYIIIPLQSVA